MRGPVRDPRARECTRPQVPGGTTGSGHDKIHQVLLLQIVLVFGFCLDGEKHHSI